MSKKVTIIDYGIGNILSNVRAFTHCGADVKIAESGTEIGIADYLVLPGVGSFCNGMSGLKDRRLVDPILRHVEAKRPLMGICLGMQMLMDSSLENGRWPGLEVIPGTVEPVPDAGADGRPHKIPHIGWARLEKSEQGGAWDRSVLSAARTSDTFYFVHSYMSVPEQSEHRLADCEYDGIKVCAAIGRDAVVGLQFHPEKSAAAGLRMIRQFLQL